MQQQYLWSAIFVLVSVPTLYFLKKWLSRRGWSDIKASWGAFGIYAVALISGGVLLGLATQFGLA